MLFFCNMVGSLAQCQSLTCTLTQHKRIMFRKAFFQGGSATSARRLNSTLTKKRTSGILPARSQEPTTPPTVKSEQAEVTFTQAPNRAATWSTSQIPRDEVLKHNVRFVGADLTKQPNPQAAIDLIAQQPINYLAHSNIAVCNGTDHQQGHPRVYINLDKDQVGTCGYCGAKYARKELEGKL